MLGSMTSKVMLKWEMMTLWSVKCFLKGHLSKEHVSYSKLPYKECLFLEGNVS